MSDLLTAKADPAAQLLDCITHLPPAPTVAVELLKLFGNPDRDLDRAVQLITHDPSLTAEVLKRCNSAYLGGEPAADMFEAVSRLGFYEVYRLVIALVASRALAWAGPQVDFDAARLWRHSVATAVAAGALAEEAGEDPAVAFTTGLLHDMGKLVFTAAAPREYARLAGGPGEFGIAFAEREADVFGTSHAVLGSLLLVRWGLPPLVACAVRYHHASLRYASGCERLTAVLTLANALAHAVVDPAIMVRDILLEHAEAWHYLELPEERIAGLLREVTEGFKQVESLFHVTR